MPGGGARADADGRVFMVDWLKSIVTNTKKSNKSEVKDLYRLMWKDEGDISGLLIVRYCKSI